MYVLFLMKIPANSRKQAYIFVKTGYAKCFICVASHAYFTKNRKIM